MKRQKKSTATSSSPLDRISELPDDILHHILRRVHSPILTARTATFSKRWRHLCLSNPVVEFDHQDRIGRCPRKTKAAAAAASAGSFHKFCNYTMERFGRDSLLPMESLNVSVQDGAKSAMDVQKLVDLAEQRKTEEVTLFSLFTPHRSSNSNNNIISLPSTLLLSLKILNLKYFKFACDDFISLNSSSMLRSLHLDYVDFGGDDRFLPNLIATSPFLETLHLQQIGRLKKLRIAASSTHLKTLEISYCSKMEEIEIVSSTLHSLRVNGMYSLVKFECSAPGLNHLEITGCDKLTSVANLDKVVSNLQHLTSLTLAGGRSDKNKLELSTTPKLEQFKVLPWYGLEEIELDGGPSLRKFVVDFGSHYPPSFREKLRKCRIRNPAAAGCQLELVIRMVRGQVVSNWVVPMKSFLANLPNLHTLLTVHSSGPFITAFQEEELDSIHTIPRAAAVKHLKIQIDEMVSQDNIEGKDALLDGCFWVCRPRFLTVIDCQGLGWCKRMLETILIRTSWTLISKRNDWQHRLQDIKIVKPVLERGQELIHVSDTSLTELANEKQACFMLTWSQ